MCGFCWVWLIGGSPCLGQSLDPPVPSEPQHGVCKMAIVDISKLLRGLNAGAV